MVLRVWHILWYAAILGIAVIIFEKIFGGLTAGLKTGLSRNLGL